MKHTRDTYQDEAAYLSLIDLIAMLYRNRVLIAAAGGIGVVLGFGVASLMPATYTASGTMVIEPKSVASLEGLKPVPVPADAVVNTEIDVLSSPAALRRALERAPIPSVGKASASGETDRAAQAAETDEQIDAVGKALDLKSKPDSFSVNVNMKWPSAEYAATFVNTLMTDYVEKERFEQEEGKRQLVALLKSQLDELNKTIASREKDAADLANQPNAQPLVLAVREEIAGLRSVYNQLSVEAFRAATIEISPNANIVSLAEVPAKPSGPRRKLIAIGGGALCVAVAILALTVSAQVKLERRRRDPLK